MDVLDDIMFMNYELQPQTLTTHCFKQICKNLNAISTKDRGYRKLAKGLSLPREICDQLIKYVVQHNPDEDHDTFFTIFKDVNATKLRNVKIVGSNLSDQSVAIITSHSPVSLELRDCQRLTSWSIDYINEHSENLQSLICYSPEFLRSNAFQRRGYVFKASNLRRLVIGYVFQSLFEHNVLLAGLPNLTHLDIYNSYGFSSFDVSIVPNLVSLTLYNTKLNDPHLQPFIESLCQLKNLRYLDISQSINKNAIFQNPNEILSTLIKGLPELDSLDISGTNLAGAKPIETTTNSNNGRSVVCGIPGLVDRMKKPLRFLGLYRTAHDASSRSNIPAQVIAGDADEEQLLITAYVCMDYKRGFLMRVLHDLYQVVRYEYCKQPYHTLWVVLEAMEKHPTAKYIQINGTATLFYAVKMKGILDSFLKTRIIRALLAGMSIYKNEESIIRNGCMALCQFRIPQDVMSNYETLVKVLLYSTTHTEPESFVQRIGIHLLNSLACQVEGKEKRLLGKLCCVKTMLQLVKERVDNNSCDEVLEVAWSTMWNMTDETPDNCVRFLELDGMSLFLKCAQQYSEKEELLRNMMGLLCNVAEVQYLRRHIMQTRYVSVIVNLLLTNTECIEVSYNAAGILAHMASDGPEAWIIDTPTRTQALEFMVEAIEKWNISAERNINYRSFAPLLRLLDVYHTLQCQHWAVWALANLTKVYPNKYCALVVKEGGIEKLNALISDPRPYAHIKELAKFVCDNCANYNSNNDDPNHLQSRIDRGYTLGS